MSGVHLHLFEGCPKYPQGHSRVAFLPFVPVVRKVLIPKGFQEIPTTVGEHILKKRLTDGLSQTELGRRIGVDANTILNWEKGYSKSLPAEAMPAIISYLGYNPEPEPVAIGARLRWKRRQLGWSIKEAAARNSVDPTTWTKWERMEDWPKYPRFRDFLRGFLETSNEELANCIRLVRPAGPRRGQRK